MNEIFILLGANLGKPEDQLNDARRLLNERLGKIISSSSLYKSEAWGVEDQPVFLNQVLLINTNYTAEDALEICQQIENKLGRVRKEKWGARLIDIDILYFNSQIIKLDHLIIPHPFIQDRKFTLLPLVEIAAQYIHPIFNQSNEQLLLNCKDKLNVLKLA